MANVPITFGGGGGSGSSDCTGAKTQALAGYTFITSDSDDEPAQGTIVTQSAAALSASGPTVTVPVGYYPQQCNKSVATGSATTPATTKAQSTPSITVSAAGLITATVAATSVSVTPSVSAGYVSSGTAGTVTMSASSNTKQLSTAEGGTTTLTATTTSFTVAANVYTKAARVVQVNVFSW